MATKEFLRNLRKKHHLGEFAHERKAFKHTAHKHSMAKKAKKKGGSHKISGIGKSIPINMIIGIAAVYATNTYIVPRIPVPTNAVAAAEVVGGLLIMNKPGVIGAIGTAAFITGALYLMSVYLPVVGNGATTSNGIVLY
jgi:hypothetical protein